MKKKSMLMMILCLLLVLFLVIIYVVSNNSENKNNTSDTKTINLTDLTYKVNGDYNSIKVYTEEDYSTFYSDYKNGNLPDVYITEFVFDGVGIYKDYDLDDYISSGNNYEPKIVKINAININTTGDIIFTGEITGATILVNTNNIDNDINLILNNASINTDSKKVPAIYVYNKDTTYTLHKVTIKTLENTKNYITGGKFKKVSLIPSDELESFTDKYSGDNLTNYNTYTSYYGVYTKDEIDNILFARETADSEGLMEGDPYYFYKGSGAISSDIDLYFEGLGYLEVTSNKKEGIESKGNIEFTSGTGDYVIYALDDCINTTTSSNNNSNVHNNLTINVNSMKAIVLDSADEGDAIDSNGELIINGGDIIALSHPGQDSGIDSDKGIYINGGTIISTGDMYDSVSDTSKQKFIVLSFNERVDADTLITLLDSNDNVVFAYKTDRTYTNLIYSSSSLTDGTYYLYKDGSITGESDNGLYLSGTYTKGTMLGYSNAGNMFGGMNGNSNRPEMPNGEIPDDSNRPEMPNGEMSDNSNRPEIPNGEAPSDSNRPEMPNGDVPNNFNMEGMNNTNMSATNKEFTISSISNIFSGIGTYTE